MLGNLVRRSAALACLLALLAGCGGNDDADPKPSFSPTPSVSSTSSSPVVESSSAAAETPEAFVRRWNEMSNAMLNSGDSSTFRSISANCEACLASAAIVDKYYGAGGYIRTDGWEIVTVECSAMTSNGTGCTGKIHNNPTSYKETKGGRVEHLDGGDFVVLFELKQSASGWTMDHISQKAS